MSQPVIVSLPGCSTVSTRVDGAGASGAYSIIDHKVTQISIVAGVLILYSGSKLVRLVATGVWRDVVVMETTG